MERFNNQYSSSDFATRLRTERMKLAPEIFEVSRFRNPFEEIRAERKSTEKVLFRAAKVAVYRLKIHQTPVSKR